MVLLLNEKVQADGVNMSKVQSLETAQGILQEKFSLFGASYLRKGSVPSPDWSIRVTRHFCNIYEKLLEPVLFSLSKQLRFDVTVSLL